MDGDKRLIFPIEPKGWERARASNRVVFNPKTGGHSVKPRFFKSKREIDFRGQIEMMARNQWQDLPWKGPIRIFILFYFARPKSQKSKNAKNWREHPCVKPDLDNLQKGVFDALNGLIYEDDAQIVQVTAQKIYCEGNESPKIELFVSKMISMGNTSGID